MGNIKNDISFLASLYDKQLKLRKDIYLSDHSNNPAVLQRQIEIFYRYKAYISGAPRILDWGCRHAVDSCLIRREFGDQIELHGCDVMNGGYHEFFTYANLKYREITHPFLLPYENDYFDVIVGSGVLEHVPDDSASLRELYRILKPDGILIITFLPNKFSYSELLGKILKSNNHIRKYTVNQIKSFLLHHGFLPLSYGYHQVLPSLSSGNQFSRYRFVRRFVQNLYKANAFVERLWPINRVSSNIFAISKKKRYFSDSWE